MRYEYRLERLPVREDRMRLARLLDRLNEQGPKGWRVVSLDLGVRPASSRGEIVVLFERERGDRP